MRIITYSEACNSLKSVLDQVANDADITIISRRDGADAIVMSLDHYQSLMETLHLLSTPANAAALARAVQQNSDGQAIEGLEAVGDRDYQTETAGSKALSG
jgi:antitoxin YefM